MISPMLLQMLLLRLDMHPKETKKSFISCVQYTSAGEYCASHMLLGARPPPHTAELIVFFPSSDRRDTQGLGRARISKDTTDRHHPVGPGPPSHQGLQRCAGEITFVCEALYRICVVFFLFVFPQNPSPTDNDITNQMP